MNRTLYISASAVRRSSAECDLSFVPPMTRRRFSPLQKMVFSLLNEVAPKGSPVKTVFASRDGEVRLTHELVETFNAEAEVSPWKFSSSVYNAAPGLYSVFSENRSTYTALAAGDETVENSLIEAVFEDGGAAWCYAEETDGGYGAAAAFSVRPVGVADVKITLGAGDASMPPVSFEAICAFLDGSLDVVTGRRISFEREK